MTSSKFRQTMDVLVGFEFKKTNRERMDDVQDWVDKVIIKNKETRKDNKECSCKEITTKKAEHSSNKYEKAVEEFKKSLDLPIIKCKFIHPHVKSRLEKLMESNVVSLTDRTYMIRLTQRIIEDYVESMEKRIQTRETKEMERIKNLVLTDQIPKTQAPLSMANHPIMLIEEHCNKLIEERRKKIKIPKAHIPTHLYYDDTPDPPSGLSIEKGHHYRMQSERLCNPITQFVNVEILDQDNENKEESPVEALGAKGTEIKEIKERKVDLNEQSTEPHNEEEFDLVKFEEELIQILNSCHTVEEIYKLADQILGELKTLSDEDAITIMPDMDMRPSIASERRESERRDSERRESEVVEQPSVSQDDKSTIE